MIANNKNSVKKILLTGGGTGGSVTPLLAVAEELRFPSDKGGLKRGFALSHETPSSSPLSGGGYEFLWLGTKFGPERAMVEEAGIKFRAIAGGKWRRYFSLKNLADVFKIKIGFWQAFFIMLKWRPDLVVGAGSFISVPVVWAAWILRVPVLIHQQDVQPGLANKLMAPFAKVITVTFEKSLKDYGKKAVWTGNLVRQSLTRVTHSAQRVTNYKLENNLPVLLIVGGGTGATAINELVAESLDELTKFCRIIHIAGKNKSTASSELRITNYTRYEFLDIERMAEALKSAEVVVTRAGMGFLTELSYLSKPAIIIPMPGSHQAENAKMFNDAAIVLDQKSLTAGKFVKEIKSLIENKELQKRLGEKMGRVMKREANEQMVKLIHKLLE